MKQQIPELKTIVDHLMEIVGSYSAGGEHMKIELIKAARDMYLGKEKHQIKETE